MVFTPPEARRDSMGSAQDKLDEDRPHVAVADTPRGPVAKSKHLVRHSIIYLTNEVVNHMPCFRLRHLWYRRIVGLELGEGSSVYLGCRMVFYGPGNMRTALVRSRIGRNTIINMGCTLDVRGAVQIGDDVSISREVAILTAQHGYNSPTFALEHHAVTIEDNVWIGMRAMILPGAHIDRGAGVAAGAVGTGSGAPINGGDGVP